MILEAMCQASEKWLKQMEEAGTPVYEYDDEWPVTIELINQSPASVEARVLAKGSELNLFVIKCTKGYKLQWRDIKWTHDVDLLTTFTNDQALAEIDNSINPFDIQSIATSVRTIGERIEGFKKN